MEVNAPGSVPSSFPLKPVQPQGDVPQPSQAKPADVQDELEISAAGKLLDDLGHSSAIRAERLAEIKAAIDAGVYETPEKLEAALERLLEELEA